MKTKTARRSQIFWIAVTIGFALVILLATPTTGSAQWTVSPSPTPTNNIYYNAGNVGIGTNAPDQKLVVSVNSAATLPAANGIIHLFGADGVQPVITNDGFAAAPVYLLRRANTSAASPSAVQANDLMGVFGVAGYGSTGYQGTRARVGFFASENWTNSANGTFMAFNTTANGAATPGGTERMRINNAGNVGIGTVAPARQLQVHNPNASSVISITTGNTGATSNDGLYLGVTNADQRAWVWNYENSALSLGTNNLERVTIQANGDVGIGTAPAAGNKLDVAGNINAAGLSINGSPITTGVASVLGRTGAVVAATNDYTWAQVNKTTSSLADLTTRSAGDLSSGTLPDARFPATLPALSGANLTALNASSLASGTVATTRLGGGTANATTFLRGDNTWAVPSGGSQWNNGGSTSISYNAGNVGIGTSAPSEALEVSGNLKISGTGNINATGTITGGNIVAKYQDVAEWVPSSERIFAGTVVVLDTTKSNQVVASTQAYDTRVAGVVSEQLGIALGEGGNGKVLVATTGRVLVKVDATNGAIRIGDLLVTSDAPGLAMKSEPVNLGGVQIHRPGTLIGKALQPLDKGSGKILVLLSLQ